MKKVFNLATCFFVSAIFLIIAAGRSHAAVTIENVSAADITPFGFSVIWQTSGAATSMLSVFSGAGGLEDITHTLEITLNPLHSADPFLEQEYFQELAKDDLKAQSLAANMVKISVSGCTPGTAYYVRLHSTTTDSSTALWPETGLFEIVTANENAFITNARQLLISMTNDAGDLDANGWIATVSAPGMSAPVSGFVGDGAGFNQAVLNLSNFFDLSGNNWAPSQAEILNLEIRIPGSAAVQRSVAVDFSGGFTVVSPIVFDVNVDQQPDVTPPEIIASPTGGQYSATQNVVLSANEDAEIFYTTDGSDPSTGSSIYQDPIQISDTTVLKFIGMDPAGNFSAIVTEVYTIVANLAPYPPSSPEPSDSSTSVSTRPVLKWQGGDPDDGDSVTYSVRYRTDDGEFLTACSDITETSCALPDLDYDQTYLWQVTVQDNYGQTTAGPVWSFTTFTAAGDEDHDDLSNEMEIIHRSNPFDRDSDRDSYGDGEEFYGGYDPLNSMSKPPYPPRYGDLDGDNDVDAEDMFLLLSTLNLTSSNAGFNPKADFNSDGVINSLDVELFTRVYGYDFNITCDPGSDLDGDGDVDGLDIYAFSRLVGLRDSDPGYNANADFNGDGIISHFDFPYFTMYLNCTFD